MKKWQQPKTTEEFLELPIRSRVFTYKRAAYYEEDTVVQAVDENGECWRLAECPDGLCRVLA